LGKAACRYRKEFRMSDELPTVEREAKMHIGNLELTVLHLSDGQRVIPAEDMVRFMEWLKSDGHEMKNVTPEKAR
jgi:hypothetical protein